MSRFFERRSFQRILTDFPATISGPSGSFEANVIDLSLGGLQLDATRIEPSTPEDASFQAAVLFEGAMTSVEFELPSQTGVARAFARVRWRSGDPRVFGVEFVDPDAETRTRIEDFITHHVNTISTLDNPVVE